MAGVREDPDFAAAIGAQPVDIAALHVNVDTEQLSSALEQTILSTGTGKCFTILLLLIFYLNKLSNFKNRLKLKCKLFV